MNRLIIIGNGFDLAHGLKTSYGDFIWSYLQDAFSSLECKTVDNRNKRFSEDRIQLNADNSGFYYIDDLISFEVGIFKKNSFNSISEAQNYLTKELEKLKLNKLENCFTSTDYRKNLKGNSDFVSEILDDYRTKAWVDIETIYSKLLYSSIKIPEFKIDTEKINPYLGVLKNKLVDYLGGISQSTTDKTFYWKMKGLLIYLGHLEETTILNFNYTNTIEQYLEEHEKENVIYIHGKLGDEKNPIIFGYGDDHHDQYLALQEKGDDELLKYQKSMLYPRTNNYGRLELFLDGKNPRKTKRNVTLDEAEGDFEVLILGHSCGLSDRTLLRTIFEHKNCKKIHIAFYNDVNDFDSKVIAISRHFTDKTKMRSRIAPFNNELKIPQFNEYKA